MLVIKTEFKIVRLTGPTKLCHFAYKLTRTKNILNILTTTKNSSDLRYLSLRTSLKHILKLRTPKRKAQNAPGSFCNWLSNRYLGLQIFPLLWCCLPNEVDLIRNKVWAQIYSLSPEFWAVAFRFLEGRGEHTKAGTPARTGSHLPQTLMADLFMTQGNLQKGNQLGD